MGKLRPRGGRTLLKPYSDQVCSYDSQTFFTNSTNTNSNNFNLLEVDDVSMSVPNLRFSAPDDKEKDKRILFSRFICGSLCQTNLESKSSCPGHEITHTHTHTHILNSILLGSLQVTHLPSREKSTWGQRPSSLPQHQVEYSSSVIFLHLNFIFSPSSPLNFFRPAFTKATDCLPHWPKHSLWEAATVSLWAGYTFPSH